MTGGGFVSVDQNDADDSRLTGHSRIYGHRALRLPILTIGLLGTQLFWSVEQSYGSPYLLSLGLSKSVMAMVFLAGPLSGLIMQPLIGVLADNCTSRFGRRRPYMAGGVLVCILAMLLLGWTKQFGGWLSSSQSLVIALGVASIYIIDFSINAVMAVERALLVDMLPSSEQPAASAWAARMMSLGGVTGFFVGNLNLPSIFPFLGDSELEILSVLASLLLLGGHVVTMFMIKEKVLLKSDMSRSAKGEVAKQFKEIWGNMKTLPRVIKQICIIQFFTWIAWFPLLFYTTLYIGDLYKRSYYTSLLATENADSASIAGPVTIHEADLEEQATRLGSRALFFSAVVSMLGNFILPFFVIETRKEPTRTPASASYDVYANASQDPLQAYTPSSGRTGFSKPSWAIPDVMKVHLSSLWASSHAVFALCMLGTFFTSSVVGATFLITITGFSWAVIMWAPLALLSEAILTEPTPGSADSTAIMLTDTRSRPEGLNEPETIFEDVSDDDEEDALKQEEQKSKLIGNHHASVSRVDVNGAYDAEDEDDERAVLVGHRSRHNDLEGAPLDGEREHQVQGLSAKAGIILGIHNIFVVVPQFLVTGLASIIFAIFDPSLPVLGDIAPSSSDSTSPAFILRQDEAGLKAASSNTVVYVFRLGGISALVAFVLCYRLAREINHR